MSPVFIHRSNCPPNNIFPAVSVSLCQRRKSHPSIHLHVAVDRSFWQKILASLSRNITDSMHTNRNSVCRYSISNSHTYPVNSFESRRRKESTHTLVHALLLRFSQSWDSTVSPLRHASLSPCASCVTDKKLDFHVIVDR